MDRRDRNMRWYGDRFDERRMVFRLEDNQGLEVEVPAVWEVCGTCEGQGSHVNPSIDSHGISAEEFYEDPDFAEDYFSGRYDVPCNECGGRRVSPTVSPNASAELRRLAEEWERGHYEMEACYEAERRMGA